MAVLTSVVDRRFAEQAVELESSEQRYRQLVESAQVILWRRSIHSPQFSFVNQEADVLLGYSLDLVVSATFWTDHIHPEDRALAEACCVSAAEENHVRIVAMTASAMQGDQDLCLRAGMDDYIAKPVRARQLIEKVEARVALSLKSQIAAPAPVRRWLPCAIRFPPGCVLAPAK